MYRKIVVYIDLPMKGNPAPVELAGHPEQKGVG